MADELEILRPKTQVTLRKETAQEFPMPFNFERRHHSPSVKRAERRRVEREALKAAKKKSR